MSTSQRPMRIRVVLDQPLHPHRCAASLRRIPTGRSAPRAPGGLRLHYRPKHASSAQRMVEIEIGVLKGQCLDRRIDQAATGSLPRSTSGSLSETKVVLESTGCSPPTRPEPKWRVPIPIPRSKSHNLCAGELGALLN